MRTFTVPSKLARCVAIAAASAFSVQAGVLYKSVDSEGKVTFSDRPANDAVVVKHIAMSESAMRGVGIAPTSDLGSPVGGDAQDEAVARANARVDLAEHALAQARRELVPEHDPLSLGHRSLSKAEAERIEFHKRDVAKARRGLMAAIQARNVSNRAVG